MATELSQDAVLLFLRSNGGSAKNAELLLHFRGFIRDNAEQTRNRELFKKFVNTVATVKQTDGVSCVVLRKKFRGHGPVLQSRDQDRDRDRDRTPGGERRWHRFQEGGEAVSKTETVLPAAGIVVNASVEAKDHVSRTPGTPGTPGRHPQSLFPALKPSTPCPGAGPLQRTETAPLHVITSGRPAVTCLPEPRQQVPVKVKSGEDITPKPSKNLQIAARRVRHRQSYKTAVSYDEDDDDDDDDDEEEEEVSMNLEHSSKPPWPPGAPLGYNGQPHVASLPCVLNKPAPPSLPSSSSHSSSDRIVPTIHIQNMETESEGSELGPGSASLPVSADHNSCWPVETQLRSTSPSHGKEAVPLQQYPPSPDHYNEYRHGADPTHPSRLSSSHSRIPPPSTGPSSTSSEGPSAVPPRAGGWGDRSQLRSEDLQARSAGEVRSLPEKQQAAPRAQSETVTRHANPLHRSTGQLFEGQASPGSLSPMHRSTEHLHDQVSGVRVMPWHLSTGDIYDCKDADSSEDSSPQQPPGVAKRLSSKLRNRMCRSLGADLDQFLQDEDGNGSGGEGRVGGGAGNEAARLNRLYRISSSLSLRYALSSSSLSSCSTPPRCHSLSNLTDPVEGSEGGRGLPDTTSTHANPEGRSRKSAVPLEPREHVWLVKGAAGAWTDIYSLFREDHSLLNRQDFISGFTVLHWIAKHGNHKVLNTLWYGAEKAGLTFDVNTKSNNGHTPLHIAAIHGNKNILRLLVTKFQANVRLRDTAGKRPWQYLSSNAPLEMFQLLGAPARVVKAGEDVGKVESSWEQQHQHRRRLRHHFSTASSGKRPLKHMGGTKVKRSTSLAAFLKHKSLHRFYGHQSDSQV